MIPSRQNWRRPAYRPLGETGAAIMLSLPAEDRSPRSADIHFRLVPGRRTVRYQPRRGFDAWERISAAHHLGRTGEASSESSANGQSGGYVLTLPITNLIELRRCLFVNEVNAVHQVMFSSPLVLTFSPVSLHQKSKQDKSRPGEAAPTELDSPSYPSWTPKVPLV